MKRPLTIAVIGYILGIIWGLYFKTSIAFIIIFIFGIYIIYNKLLLNKIKKLKSARNFIRYMKIFLNICGNSKSNNIHINAIIIVMIFAIISNTITIFLNNKFENKYSNIRETSIVATVVSNKTEKQYKYVYKLKIEYIENDKSFKNTYLLLNVKKNSKIELEYGDVIKLKGQFEEPANSRNYKGFSYRNYLKSIKVYGTVDIIGKVEIIKKENINPIQMLANKFNKKMQAIANEILPKETRYLFLGILLGDTENIEQEIIDNFKNSSLSHMLAVSGSHISYIIVGATFIIEKMKFNKRYGKIVTIIILIFFMFVTNFSASVVRACIMGIIIMGAGFFYRKSDTITSISFSLLCILIENPFNITNIGLILSFGGTIGIISFYNIVLDKLIVKKDEKKKQIVFKVIIFIKEMLAVTISAQIVIFPIMLIIFNTTSLTFFISNVIAGPLMGIITIGGFAICFISCISIEMGKFLGIFMNFVLQILILIAKFCGMLPLSKIYVINPNILIICIYFFIIYFLKQVYILKKKQRKYKIENKLICFYNHLKKSNKKIIATILVCILIINLIKIFPQELKIYFIDVGQGDSTLIVTPNGRTILIDGGGSRDRENFDVGESVLLPYLLNRGICKIDYMMISHFDSDHCGRTYVYIRKFICKTSNYI